MGYIIYMTTAFIFIVLLMLCCMCMSAMRHADTTLPAFLPTSGFDQHNRRVWTTTTTAAAAAGINQQSAPQPAWTFIQQTNTGGIGQQQESIIVNTEYGQQQIMVLNVPPNANQMAEPPPKYTDLYPAPPPQEEELENVHDDDLNANNNNGNSQ